MTQQSTPTTPAQLITTSPSTPPKTTPKAPPANMPPPPTHYHHHVLLLFLLFLFTPTSALDFLFESFNASTPGVLLISDARIDYSVIRLTNDTKQYSLGRAFYPTQLRTNKSQNSSTTLTSFSTSFVFSILPDISTGPGYGLAFVLSNWTNPPNALASQYFGLFTNASFPPQAPLFAVEFDTGLSAELNEQDDNHIGIDLNNVESIKTHPAGYFNSSGSFVFVNMRDGQNVRAWIDFDGGNFEINVTIAPVGISRPSLPTLSYKDPVIANYVSPDMYVGFSASKITWVEAQRILAWSFSDTGSLREINTTNLPLFSLPSPSNSLSPGAISGITIGCLVFVGVIAFGFFWHWGREEKLKEEEEIEDWELEYWPHKFPYEELAQATNGFSKNLLLGAGGFGKVYKGTIPDSNNPEIAVKCINHNSKQGLREFMAEISSMGRLQHKNLVQMRGWCKRSNLLLLVYDYMPNGSLDRYIFGNNGKRPLNWEERRRILADVAEGLNYLHHGWEQVVIHRDIKSSNILLDSGMRGRLGDFGLAKLYSHDGVPKTTRVVGTLGYLAPELATLASPTTASDVYSFGVVVLEAVCGRKPIELGGEENGAEDVVLVEWVREIYGKGQFVEAADGRLRGEYKVGEMEVVLKLGLACCHPDPVKRPSMKKVVAILVEEDTNAAEPARLLSELAHGGGIIHEGGGGGGGNLATT